MSDIGLIDLPNGKQIILDADWHEMLKSLPWYIGSSPRAPYIKCSVWKNNKQGVEYLHKIILDAPKGMQGDHINGDTLDNRRANLRVCTTAENSRNRPPHINIKGRTSNYKGVTKSANGISWVAVIKSHGKRYHIGTFKTEIEAAKAYNEFARKHHGEFAWLNPV